MKNKLALVFCVHHKPWLVMSTLITTMAQDFKDFDIFFIHQKGDGTTAQSRLYKEYFDEYYSLAKKYNINSQLDPYDPRTVEVCRMVRANTYGVFFENDHALDSGAWYKFIRSGLWKDYEYLIFAGEGILFTGETVFSDTLRFAKQYDAHFITASHAKRRIPKDRFFGNFASFKNKTEMNSFHDKMIKESLAVFCRDHVFKEKLDLYRSDFQTEQQNHVPDIWGHEGLWMRAVNLFYPNVKNFKGPIQKQFIASLNSIFFLWIRTQALLSIFLREHFGMFYSKGCLKRDDDYIYTSWGRRRLQDTVSYSSEGALKFHRSSDPEWYGASCSHFVSREFLERFSRKLEEYKIYDVIELPFSATSLEVIWGLIPLWLGFDKWFFNGMHRVHKNFVNYRREDNARDMARYINRYYQGRLYVDYQDDYLKIKKYSRDFKNLKEYLNELYF